MCERGGTESLPALCLRHEMYSRLYNTCIAGNTLWEEFLLPHAQQANAMVTKEEWQLALGELFGMLLFAVTSFALPRFIVLTYCVHR